MNKEKKYIVVLPYINGVVSLSHLGRIYIPADIYSRYLQMKGENVLFISGSYDNNIKHYKEKREFFISNYEMTNKECLEEFGIDFNVFCKNDTEANHKFYTDFVKSIFDKEAFDRQERICFYDEESNQFLQAKNVLGKCTRCGYSQILIGQCRECGEELHLHNTSNQRSIFTGNKLSLRKCTYWYLNFTKNRNKSSTCINDLA